MGIYPTKGMTKTTIRRALNIYLNIYKCKFIMSINLGCQNHIKHLKMASISDNATYVM